MFKSYKISVVISTAIPLTAYAVWLAFFSKNHPLLLSSEPEAVITFAIATSAIMAAVSLFFHIVYNLYYIEKLRTAMHNLYEMNSRVQDLTEDLSEVSNYNLELVSDIMKASQNQPANNGKAHPTLARMNQVAEEVSLRAEITAAEIKRVDTQFKRLFAQPRPPDSKLARLWESSYFYR